jgi:hypothetical protein
MLSTNFGTKQNAPYRPRPNRAKFIPTKKLKELVDNEGVGIDGDDTWQANYSELLSAYIDRVSKMDDTQLHNEAKEWDLYEEYLDSVGVPPIPSEALL